MGFLENIVVPHDAHEIQARLTTINNGRKFVGGERSIHVFVTGLGCACMDGYFAPSGFLVGRCKTHIFGQWKWKHFDCCKEARVVRRSLTCIDGNIAKPGRAADHEILKRVLLSGEVRPLRNHLRFQRRALLRSDGFLYLKGNEQKQRHETCETEPNADYFVISEPRANGDCDENSGRNQREPQFEKLHKPSSHETLLGWGLLAGLIVGWGLGFMLGMKARK